MVLWNDLLNMYFEDTLISHMMLKKLIKQQRIKGFAYAVAVISNSRSFEI